MELLRMAMIGVLGPNGGGTLVAQPPAKKRLLFIGQSKGFQHDSV